MTDGIKWVVWDRVMWVGLVLSYTCHVLLAWL